MNNNVFAWKGLFGNAQQHRTGPFRGRTDSRPPSPTYFLFLADFFFLTDLVVGLTAAFFVPNTESQFFENSGVGAVRTIGPDIVN